MTLKLLKNLIFKNAVNNCNLSSNEDLLLSTTHLSDPVQISYRKIQKSPVQLIPYINKSTYSIRKRIARMVEFPPNV